MVTRDDEVSFINKEEEAWRVCNRSDILDPINVVPSRWHWDEGPLSGMDVNITVPKCLVRSAYMLFLHERLLGPQNYAPTIKGF